MKSSSLLTVVLSALLFGCASSETAPPGSGGSGAGSDTGGNAGQGGAGGDGGSSGPCLLAEDCTSVADACNLGTCINSVCEKAPTHEGLPCDDGLSCTLTEICQAGACVGNTQMSCPASDACHVGTCDLDKDGCTEMPGNEGAFCTDTDPCTQTSFCSGGTCVGGQKVDCSFLSSECAVGVCDPQAGCVAMPLNDGAPCDDFSFCTSDDTCQGGTCTGGAPTICPSPSNPCFVGVCDLNSDTCTSQPGNDGAACDDGSSCTGGETCGGGQCGGGAPVNPGVACDDGDGCTVGTTCQSGLCGSPISTIVACVDSDACCPAGCPTDTDCKTDVLVLHSDDPFSAQDVQTKLMGTGAFTSVGMLSAEGIVPQLADLMPYQAVLVYSFNGYSNPIGVGDLLADYFDAGGRVVLAPGANCAEFGFGIEGRFVTDGYMVLNKGPIDPLLGFDSLGAINEPGSLLVAGVNSLSAAVVIRCLGMPVPGATTVAQWGGGQPLIVRGVVNGKNRVDLNLYPVSADAMFDFWMGDGAAIMKNALLYK